jgi:4-diphosphocytidyl-2-C-methyl-D-erythritol kinase
MSATRRARVRALAKINLDLRVLGLRPDGYHELRTIFQTVSLADTIDLAFTPGRRTRVDLADPLAIPDNLVLRAARLVLESSHVSGALDIRLRKRIPLGAGLGGGSSDAAAILLALPVLAGGHLPLETLLALAQQLGSDVPFFLLGGRAAGIGRGTEIFPLPDGRPLAGVLLAPGIHVSTAGAYRALSPGLTSEFQQNKIVSFQSQAWEVAGSGAPVNDFETVVLKQHKALAELKRRLAKCGAVQAMMTGSGSAVFGLFSSAALVASALSSFGKENAVRISLVTRARYRSLWWRALAEHSSGRIWPPQSRYMP